MNAQNGLATCD